MIVFVGDPNDEYVFYLVEFYQEKIGDLYKAIDCVPCTWADIDEETNEISTFYPPLPFPTLAKMVKNNDPPNMNWDMYDVHIKGRASKF